MAVLGLGGVLAAVATAWMQTAPVAGVALAVFAFLLIGAGVGASGTCLLVLLAAGVPPRRRAAAASITWIMMIAGFAVTAGVVGANLDPFSFPRLIAITAIVSVAALSVTAIAIRGLENRLAAPAPAPADGPGRADFRRALTDVLAEPHTRRFAAFVFISMLAYSAQDLVLEPFAGAVFGLTPGESTQLGGTQHGGVLLGMVLVALVGYLAGRGKDGVLRLCMIGGCIGSAALLAGLAVAGYLPERWPLNASVFALGLTNGIFAVAAIGSMMALVSRGHRDRDGVRMGIWGAAQALAFGLGGVAGTLAVDVVRALSGSVVQAYAFVFAGQALLFTTAALLAAQITRRTADRAQPAPVTVGAEAGPT
jgi:BCD family chlorophyll transporter-like MFS transporter